MPAAGIHYAGQHTFSAENIKCLVADTLQRGYIYPGPHAIAPLYSWANLLSAAKHIILAEIGWYAIYD